MLVLAASGVGVFLAARVLYKSGSFFVKDVSASVPFPEAAALQKELQRVSLFTIPIERYQAFIKQRHPEYKEVHVLKVFPQTLKVKIVERRPFAQVSIGRKYYYIDEEAVIISDGYSERDSAIVEFTGKSLHVPSVKKGITLSQPEVRAGILLWKELQSKKILHRYPVITALSISSLSSIYFELGGVLVHVGEPPYGDKISLLSGTLLPEFKNSFSDLKQIDLRFTPPVIGYKR